MIGEDDVRNIMDTLGSTPEPPLTVGSRELLDRGRRHRRRRMLATVGGGVSGVAAVVAVVALLVPALTVPGGGNGPGTADKGSVSTEPSEPDGTSAGTAEDVRPPEGLLPEYSAAIADAFAARFPDQRYVPAVWEEDDAVPFAMDRYDMVNVDGDPVNRLYSGSARIMDTDDKSAGDVFVEIVPPGSWIQEPADMLQRASMYDDVHLYTCWGDNDADPDEPQSMWRTTECENGTTEAGDPTVVVRQNSGLLDQDAIEMLVVAIVFRADGTAVKASWDCAAKQDPGDEDELADYCSADTMPAEDLLAVLTELPEVPVS